MKSGLSPQNRIKAQILLPNVNLFKKQSQLSLFILIYFI